MNDAACETVVAGVRFSAISPGWRAAWKMARPNFGGRFLAFMDDQVAASAAERPADLSLDAWRVAFAAEAARTSQCSTSMREILRQARRPAADSAEECPPPESMGDHRD